MVEMEVSVPRFVALSTIVAQTIQERQQLVEVLESDDIFLGQSRRSGWRFDGDGVFIPQF